MESRKRPKRDPRTSGARPLCSTDIGRRSVCVIRSRPSALFPDLPRIRTFEMVNPVILCYWGGVVVEKEGCLSFLDVLVKVPRYFSIKVQYFNMCGDKIVCDFHGILARVVLHEIDHLLGKTILNYLTEPGLVQERPV